MPTARGTKTILKIAAPVWDNRSQRIVSAVIVSPCAVADGSIERERLADIPLSLEQVRVARVAGSITHPVDDAPGEEPVQVGDAAGLATLVTGGLKALGEAPCLANQVRAQVCVIVRREARGGATHELPLGLLGDLF